MPFHDQTDTSAPSKAGNGQGGEGGGLHTNFTNPERMNKSDQSGSGAAYDEIARGAYYLWEGAGRPDGRTVEHWLEAETRLQAERVVCDGSGAAADPVAPEAARRGRTIRYGLVLRA